MESQDALTPSGEMLTREEKLEREEMLARLKEQRNKSIELCLWMIAAFIISGGMLVDILAKRGPPLEVISARYVELLLALLTFFFPLVFDLIFGALPLESIRRKRAQRQLERSAGWMRETVRGRSGVKETTNIPEAEIRVLSDSMSIDDLYAFPATKLFAYYASSSRRLSQSIYSRAGVYLLVGVLVAFSGLPFFYSQTARVAASPPEGLSLLVILAPKFGILFFIEIVAFFFLRQYRAAMDEFRYYEAIKRSREETLGFDSHRC